MATDKPLVYPRKEAETARATVEGPFAPGEQVAVIEDLVTSGGSVLRAVETLRSAGLQVDDVVVLIKAAGRSGEPGHGRLSPARSVDNDTGG